MTSKKNRNPVKQMFITFPHSNVDKYAFRDVLLKLDPEYYKICEEHHKDGSPHLYAVVKYKNKFSKSHILKFFEKEFPNDYKRIDIETVRSIKNALAYLSKEDNEPLESGQYQETRGTNRERNVEKLENDFARALGYCNKQDLDEHEEERKDLINLAMAKLQEIAEFEGYDHWIVWLEGRAFEENFFPFELRKILQNLIKVSNEVLFSYIPKDDITLLLKSL